MNGNGHPRPGADGLGALGALAVLGALVALWWGASNAGWVSRVFLPTPQAVFASLLEGLDLSRDAGNGELIAFTQATVGHMLQGWLLASLFGVLLGTAIGVSPVARAWVQPTLEFIRPLPASALLPLALSIFGLNRGTVLFVVAFGAMWPVLLATVHGLATLEPRLSEVARCLQMSRGAQVWKMGLPNAMPDILAGMRLALTVALIVAVVGEMIAAQSGLGQAILLAARAFRASDLFAGIALLGGIGFVSNALLAGAEKRWLRWQHP
ncbi:ABC transporter permease [Verminephrobacter eiseniae]|uniref:ABC transporter permease n=1 Tax=Verminephrobacter eiseniae TaxID=364317 RepID=UPI0022389A17|nr:ABC transporter permease [Verminephrobacter eiseniae]MCW5261372.1 ABC transporter permease [Verminephrobacter eiseniae]